MIRTRCESGLEGWLRRLRDNYKSFEEFEACCANYGISKRLGFEDARELWDENPYVHGSVNPDDLGIHTFPDCYLYVVECRSGDEWIRPLRGNSSLDLATQIRKWVKEEYGGELYLDGKLQPRLEGDYYAKIMMDGRPPDSVVCWTSAGFWLTDQPNALLRRKS